MRRPSFIATFFLLLAFAIPASAYTESGTHAWSTSPLVLSSGPGSAYHVTGQIAENAAIKVLRCQRLWCLVDGEGGRGWTSRDHISVGKTPADWPGGINPDYPSGGPGEVCFYTGTNFTGRRMIADHYFQFCSLTTQCIMKCNFPCIIYL